MIMSSIRWLHVDMDSYFASCEQQANPLLRDKPVGVCGNPQGGSKEREGISRSVVAAASREAKEFGVQSGMPPFEARKLCSDILLVPADGAKYKDVTSRFLSIFSQYSPQVEPFSIDEAFLSVSSNGGRFEDPRELALCLQEEVKDKLGPYITCSCGLGENKFLAKVASDLKKPEGVFRLDHNNKKEVFAKLELSDVFGIGAKTAKRLQKLGVNSLRTLREASLGKLQEEFGQRAYNLKRIARGKPIDSLENFRLGLSSVDSQKDLTRKSCGRSQTLASDRESLKELKSKILALCKEIAEKLREENLAADTVKVGLKFADRSDFSKQRKRGRAFQDELCIFNQALSLFEAAPQNKAIRKVGIRASNLKPQKQKFLFEEDRQRKELLQAQDRLNKELGEDTLLPLRALEESSKD